ncbi:glyoxalase [Chromobacterium amazonense]|uniref:VOC family protein n=1 Tax=Chromobacterium amazonense TaxID=1382803 RepID=UPI0008D9C61F|nr:VOC family protein [Chromobacterium amazonense]OHX11075.1 glyoxalase [Chromobacterium amazonense]
MISHLDHIVLTVRDIEASVTFYQRALKLEAVSFGNGRRALRFGNQKINLQTLGQETRNHAVIGSGDLCLITDLPLTEVMAHLKQEGVAIVEGPVTRSGAMGPITSVYFNDPDGNLIEVGTYSF